MLVQMLITVIMILVAIYVAYRLFVKPWLDKLEKQKEKVEKDNQDVLTKVEEREETLRRTRDREKILVKAVDITEELGDASEQLLNAEAQLDAAEARPETSSVEQKYNERDES